MDNFEFLKSLYEKENDRKQEILESLNIPVALLTVAGTGLYFCATTFDYDVNGFHEVAFCAIIFLTLVLFGLSVYHACLAFNRLFKGYQYDALPYPSELYNYYNTIKASYIANNALISEADNAYSEYLAAEMANITDYNMDVNQLRFTHIQNTKKYTIATLITLFLTCIPFGYNYFHKKDTLYRVEVVESEKDEMRERNLLSKVDSIKIALQSIHYTLEHRKK